MTVEENSLKNNKSLCACGCGSLVIKKFKRGHSNKGVNNSQWKGGRKKSGNYWFLYMPEYFHQTTANYISEHIYFYEQYHKCCLLPWGHVHHIDPVTKDYCNNMPWNLEGMTMGQHTSIHNIGNKYGKKDMSNRYCLLCDSTTTYVSKKTNWSRWHSYQDGFICNKCYCKKKK